MGQVDKGCNCAVGDCTLTWCIVRQQEKNIPRTIVLRHSLGVGKKGKKWAVRYLGRGTLGLRTTAELGRNITRAPIYQSRQSHAVF